MKKYYKVFISISILIFLIACIRKWDFYGHSGFENLHMNEKMKQSLERFQNSIKGCMNLDLIPTQKVISDSLYTKLVLTNLNNRDSLIRTVSKEYYSKDDSIRRGYSNYTKKDTIAIISYFSFGEENEIAFAEDGLKLFYLDESKIGILAQNIGANYLVAVHFDPLIDKWDPTNLNAVIHLDLCYRLFDESGNTLIDKKIKNFNRKVNTEISIWDHAKMTLAAIFFSFPTKLQHDRLVLIENSILDSLIKESEQLISQDILKHIEKI